ncbi:MAG: hypothetical protein RL011_1395 [Pseudomonadota bacterium]
MSHVRVKASWVASLFVSVSLLSVPAAAARSMGDSKDPGQLTQLKIKSTAALVVDLDTNTTLFERDADVVRPIASISKIFGALVIVEECKLDPDGLHEMSSANRDAAKGGDKTKLTTGWSYSHKDLLHAALMRSDNRALPALAQACGLDPVALATKMTERARKMGLVKTTFKEPDGLSPENVSTAREVMIALKESMKNPTLTEIMAKPEYVLVAHKGDRARDIKIKNTDRLLSKNIAQILAGKTGYTDIARYCLAVAAKTFEGRQLGMVFLGAEGKHTRFADFTRVIKWLTSSEAIAAANKSPANGGNGQSDVNGSAAASGAVGRQDATQIPMKPDTGSVEVE